MAYFDELNRESSSKAELNRLKGALAQAEQKRDSCYFLIGKKYMELHRTDCEEPMLPIVGELNKAIDEADYWDKALLEYQGLVRCPDCNAVYPVGNAFCLSCGSKAPAPPEGMMRCPGCRKLIPEGTRFCSICGFGIAPAPQPDIPAAPICPQCGTPAVAGTLFCINCGCRL